MALVEALAGLVEELCAAGPVMLIVDDLQWADDASLLAWYRLSRCPPRRAAGRSRRSPPPPDLTELAFRLLVATPATLEQFPKMANRKEWLR